jgi:hypothetical protein
MDVMKNAGSKVESCTLGHVTVGESVKDPGNCFPRPFATPNESLTNKAAVMRCIRQYKCLRLSYQYWCSVTSSRPGRRDRFVCWTSKFYRLISGIKGAETRRAS